MLALTFSTGIIDAAGYLGLDRVFTGNMTGNVVILGMGLAGADDLPIIGPIIALTAFMIGAAFAGRLGRVRGPGWSGRTTFLLLMVAVVLTLVGLVYDSRFAADNEHPWIRRLLSVALIGMGAWTGAHLLALHFSWSVGLSAVVTAAVVAVGEPHRRTHVLET